MKAHHSLALVLVGFVGAALAAGAVAACTSGTTPNCSPDAAGSDACGQPATEGGTANAIEESTSSSSSGADTGMPQMEAGPESSTPMDSSSSSSSGGITEAGGD